LLCWEWDSGCFIFNCSFLDENGQAVQQNVSMAQNQGGMVLAFLFFTFSELHTSPPEEQVTRYKRCLEGPGNQPRSEGQ
jgi:hypothetical protein